METRPGETKHGDFAARRGAAPARRAARPFADGEKTEPHDERPSWFAEGLEASRATGSRPPVDMATGGGHGPE
jgi:hypothetical protein